MCEETTLVNPWLQTAVTIIGTLLASSGFWAYIQKKDATNRALKHMTLGLAYDKIIAMGLDYIARGWLTQDEYEDYRRYLYDPYKALGGNGVTERIVAEVSSLPIRPRAKYVEVLAEAKTRSSGGDQHPDNPLE